MEYVVSGRTSVRIEPSMTGLSHELSLLELADLCTGSVPPKFGKEGEGKNAKTTSPTFSRPSAAPTRAGPAR
jgi:hypothetical protein